MEKPRVRSRYRVGPFKVTGSAGLAIVITFVALVVCGVGPCVVGALVL